MLGTLTGVWMDVEGRVPALGSLSALERFAASNGVALAPDPGGPLDLQLIDRWLRNRRARRIDCTVFLDAWNLFADVARSVGAELPDGSDLANKCYDKLFWGCNLPSVTPPGKHYVPIWNVLERNYLRTLLGAGLALLRSRMTHVEQ